MMSHALGEAMIKELVDDEEVNRKTLPEVEKAMNDLNEEMEEEIKAIKLKYEKKVKKLKNSAEFLRTNPYLKNIKEYAEFSKFKSKFEAGRLGTMKSSFGDGDDYDISVGGCNSIYAKKAPKISDYKSNNIKNKL